MSQLALMIDIERCFGCKSCEAACKQEHLLGAGEYRNKVVWLGNETSLGLDFLTLTCQHCERPACLRACPVHPNAISKDPLTGVVEVIQDRCTGCGECVIACPYSAMGYDPAEHHAVKCDLCPERRSAGLEPACASICPGYAISFGQRESLLTEALREEREVRDHDHFLLKPQTIYLERVQRGVSSRHGSASYPGGFDRRPAFMDAPESQHVLNERSAAFPYREERRNVQPDHVVPGGCDICFNCCTAKFQFKGDELVKITGNEEDPVLKGKLCPKAQMTLQMYNNKHRLRYPMKRSGKRGENRFERISWGQALDEIAEKLTAIGEKWGPEALALFVGTRTGIVTKQGYVRLFQQMWGTPNIEGTDPFCATSKSIAYELVQGAVGSGNSYTPDDMGSAGMYLFIGDNMAETRPVYFGMINDWRIKNRAKMAVVDPRCSVTASKADIWLPIRPGTDMALGLAMAHHIFSEGIQDRKFCEKWIVGWERWRDFILETDHTPEWAAPLTGLGALDIRSLAEDVARADGCVIFGSRGINQHTNGVQTNRVFMFLAAITGNWGRKGGTYFNMTAGVPIAPNVPENRRGDMMRPRIRRSPAGWLEAMRTGRPYPLKALIACNNPMAQWPAQSASREALLNLDLIVHIELFANETSAFADYVLPAAGGIEKGEIGRSNDDRRIVWIDKMIEPPGEAKPDGWIWIELGKRLGFGDVLEEKYKDSRIFWDDVCINNDQLRGVTQERLHSRPYRWVRYPVANDEMPEKETLYLEGTTASGQSEGKRFPTPSGKLEFWTEVMEEKFRDLGLSALPEFYTEREQLLDMPYVEFEHGDDSLGLISPFHHGIPTGASRCRIQEPNEENPGAGLRSSGFDLELITGRPPAPHFHSWTHYFWQAQEMWPDLYCQIHPDQAAKLGVQDGEKVQVESSHGSIEAVAWINAGIRPTAVFIPIGWGERQPYHPWRSVNFLTDKDQRDPVSDQTNFKSLLCRVKKL